MATSSITRSFVVEGQDAEDFANSLDLAFAERDERMKSFKKAMPITDERVIDKALEGIFKNVQL